MLTCILQQIQYGQYLVRNETSLDTGQCSDLDRKSCRGATAFDKLWIPCTDGSVHVVELVMRCGCVNCRV